MWFLGWAEVYIWLELGEVMKGKFDAYATEETTLFTVLVELTPFNSCLWIEVVLI